MKLYDWQKRAVKQLPVLLKKHGRVVAVAPTGSGKTTAAVALIKQKRFKRVLWIAHRIELLRQAKAELVAAGIPESRIGILSGPDKHNEDAPILVASINLVGAEDVAGYDLIVVDEAHRSQAKSYRAILDAAKCPILGLTATPWRLDGKGLADVYRHLFVMAGQTELIADGVIAQPVTYGIPEAKAKEIVKGLKVGNGDYQLEQIGPAMLKRKLVGNIVTEWERLAKGVPTIVFAASRPHGQAIAKRFKRRGYRVEYIDGDTPEPERKQITARLKTGKTTIVVNVDVYSEGFDCPPVKCIVLARPTRSLTRFLQQVGRAARKFGRKRPIILDHAGNVWRHHLPELDRDWSLDGKPTRNGLGQGPVRYCPECGHMNQATAKECQECGAEFPLPERVLRERKAKLERLKPSESQMAAARKQIENVANLRNAPDGWVKNAMLQMFGSVAA